VNAPKSGPRIRRTQRERTALSDQRLTAAAVELLVLRGVDGTTLSAIAEISGYSRGLVTHRFGSKAGLLAHVHDTVANRWLAHVNAAVGEQLGLAALLQLVTALGAFIEQAADELRAMYLLRYASTDPGAAFKAGVAQVHRAQRRAVERWIHAGQRQGEIDRNIDPAIAAELLCASLDGLLYRWHVDPEIPVRALQTMLRNALLQVCRVSDDSAGFPPPQ